MNLKKELSGVAEIAAKIMNEKLHPNQQKLDVHEPEKDKLTAKDFEMLRAGKKAPMKKEEVEQIDELSTGALKSYMKGAKADQQANKDEKSSAMAADDHKTASDAAAKIAKRAAGMKVAKAKMNAEEVELDEVFEKGDPVGTKKKTSMGVATKTATGMKHERTPEKDVEAGTTDWDKEEKLAKKHLSPKPAKKYGARQNYVRSTRVNESFSELLSVYKEGGLKALSEKLVVEEPTEDEFNAEIKTAQDKSEGKIRNDKNIAAGKVDAVKEVEESVDEINGVSVTTIDEREMTDAQMKKREDIVKSMKKGMSGFKERYGERAKNVMYATATKQAMKD